MDPAVKLSALCKRTDALQEFPITRGKYTGGDLQQIPDRVIIKISGKNKAVYCGLITHEVSKVRMLRIRHTDSYLRVLHLHRGYVDLLQAVQDRQMETSGHLWLWERPESVDQI